jgi:hypothetical protein
MLSRRQLQGFVMPRVPLEIKHVRHHVARISGAEISPHFDLRDLSFVHHPQVIYVFMERPSHQVNVVGTQQEEYLLFFAGRIIQA